MTSDDLHLGDGGQDETDVESLETDRDAEWLARGTGSPPSPTNRSSTTTSRTRSSPASCCGGTGKRVPPHQPGTSTWTVPRRSSHVRVVEERGFGPVHSSPRRLRCSWWRWGWRCSRPTRAPAVER